MKKNKKSLFISQKSNFSGEHGYVVRSSAIFYFASDEWCKTTISFMNYWKVKRNLDVMIIASTRTMCGRLVNRDVLNFESGMVCNYRPKLAGPTEGAIEIEVFSNTNMVIPYAAIMAVYETNASVSMVHSYGRTYSPHEVEENRTISIGNESCWTIRDSSKVKSFCVFHNGYGHFNSQQAILILTNHNGEKKRIVIELKPLEPFESIKLYPRDYCPDIDVFLGGEPGNASLSYELANAFTRLLVGNESDEEIQVTHSNFNYAIHNTDFVSGKFAYMNVVNADFDGASVVVYPDCSEGEYTMYDDQQQYAFEGNKRIEIPVERGTLLKFSRQDGALPSRIVTAFCGKSNRDNVILPFECSLGIHHDEYPKKRSHWGLVSSSKKLRSRIIAQFQTELFGKIKQEDFVEIALYSSGSSEALKVRLESADMKALHDGRYVEDIFHDSDQYLSQDFGYIYLTTSYPGLSCFTTLEKETGSISFEHSF